MKILAMDTSCDESSASVFDSTKWRLLSDVVCSHAETMEKFGGVVPEMASREHLKFLPLACQSALKKAGLSINQIDWIAVTNRPGLIGALLVGVSFAKALAFSLGIPFSSHHHIEAHLFSPLLCEPNEVPPPFPWLALVVSGGHTELFLVEGKLRYRWLGGTVDDAAGEAFDKIGKLLGLSYPAGPKIDQWVKEKVSPSLRDPIRFPRSRPPGYEFSFSGLKTAVHAYLKSHPPVHEDEKIAIASSAQEAILDSIIQKLEKAKEAFPHTQIVVTGGVACNSRLREKLAGAYFPKASHCTDNAAMVSLLASLYEKGGELHPAPWQTTAFPSGDL